jgi:hypothetical protein
MTHHIRAKVSVLSVALLVALASFGVARHAQAAPDYPPRLQSWLEGKFNKPFCVPQCTVCHLNNLGGFGTLNVFGANLKKYGGLLGIPNDPNFASDIDKYFAAVAAGMANGDSDGNGVPDLTELDNLMSPAGPGQICPDIEYGCAGGRIASSPPPTDRFGLLSAGLVLAGFAVMRRRQRRTKRAG